jgi:anti-sigma B factor antagonist
MLDEADAFCEEELLTLQTPVDILRFREWFLSEFTRQIEDGLSPRPWSPPAQPVQDSGQRLNGGDSGDSRWLEVSGDVDLATAGELRERIRQVVDDGIRPLTMDLTKVTFLDSIGLGLLVATQKRLAEDGHTLAVIVPTHLSALFEVSGLKDVFEIRPSQG